MQDRDEATRENKGMQITTILQTIMSGKFHHKKRKFLSGVGTGIHLGMAPSDNELKVFI